MFFFTTIVWLQTTVGIFVSLVSLGMCGFSFGVSFVFFWGGEDGGGVS